MKNVLVSVAHAGAIRTPGFGRVELTITRTGERDYLTDKADRRELAAAVYCVAARLEQIAAAEGLEFSASTTGAHQGVIDVDFRGDAVTTDVIDEILIEACADVGLLPTDAEVSS